MLIWVELGVILSLVLLSGLFAGAEIALLSVRKTRLGELSDQGHGAATAALALRRDPERLLATIQVAITVLGAATAVLGGARFEQPLAGLLMRTGMSERYAEVLAFATVVSGVSYISLVLGELVPKSIALRHSESVTLLVARLLATLSRIAAPVVWLLTWSSNIILRPLRDSTTFIESKLSSEELQQLVEEASMGGSLPPAAGEIASRALDLAHLRVKDVMIPRGRVVGIAVGSSPASVRDVLRGEPHSRYPVYAGSIDDVLGYVTERQLYEAMQGEGLLDLRGLVKPIVFVPESTSAVQALRRLQAERQRLGLVVDETGGIIGAITITDVAEELLGDILDESESPVELVRVDADGTLLVRGETPIHDVERYLGSDLAAQGVRASTIAGLVLEELGRIPKSGERVNLGAEVHAEVVEASERRVRALRIRRLPAGRDPGRT